MAGYVAPDFSGWDSQRLAGQQEHLLQILATTAGQPHPLKAQLRSELAAIRAEIGRREDKED